MSRGFVLQQAAEAFNQRDPFLLCVCGLLSTCELLHRALAVEPTPGSDECLPEDFTPDDVVLVALGAIALRSQFLRHCAEAAPPLARVPTPPSGGVPGRLLR